MRKIAASVLMLCICGRAFALGLDMNQSRTITADKIEYDVKSETIKTTGKTEIVNQAGQKMTLTDSYISQKGMQIDGQEVEIWLSPNVYFESDHVTRDGNITIARDAMFTACADCDKYGDAWQIYSTKMRHNQETRMLSFTNPVLYTYGVPVFWMPYYIMPDPGVKHKTGFLMPDFGSTNKMGTQINVPFHISFSDYHDATLTLSYLTQENPLFQADHRLNLNHSEYRTTGAYTHNRAGVDRWYVFNNDVIDMGEYVRTTVYLERTSDRTFMQKYGFYNAQPYLDSGAKVEVFGQSSYAVADAHIFQELRRYSSRHAVPSGNILPNVRAVHQTSPFFNETYATFGTDILGISGNGTSSQRIIGDARVVSPWTVWGGNRITASVASRYDVYNFENTVLVDDTTYSGLKTRFLPSGYLEWGLPLMRPGREWMQTIEPRARITAMRHLDEEAFALNNDSAGAFLSDTTLFSDNRFPGLDLWENGTFADYGVRWAASNQNDGRTTELFLGQTYDIAGRADTDPNSGFHNGASDYVGRVGFNNNTWLNLYSRFRFGRQDLDLRHMETTARLGDSKNFVNIGHIWSQQFIDLQTRDDNISEGVAGFGIQVAPRWALRWNATYNMTTEKFQRHSGGIYYEHPCYYVTLTYQRDNAVKGDYVGNTTFQFKFGISIDGQKH